MGQSWCGCALLALLMRVLFATGVTSTTLVYRLLHMILCMYHDKIIIV